MNTEKYGPEITPHLHTFHAVHNIHSGIYQNNIPARLVERHQSQEHKATR